MIAPTPRPRRPALVATVLITLVALGALSAVACSDEAGASATAAPTADGGAADGAADFGASEPLEFAVPDKGRVYVSLSSPPKVVTPADPKTDRGWDLAFEGLDVFTNSGPSGGGSSSAFGPIDSIAFLDDIAPEVPFLSPDTTGGAFIRWWLYGGSAGNHALFTRYHVYGVKDGDKQYKVQVLNYYGVKDGAPTAALYRVRWAEITPTGFGPTHDLLDLDGIAGGTQAPVGVASECLDLGTSARTMLTPEAARASSAWHLCFRRENISVNGEVGGPRGVTAVDLDADKSAGEKLADFVPKTPDTELPRFDAVNAQSLVGQPFRGDRVISAFGTLWLERGAVPAAPARSAWLVVGADGTSKHLVGFARFLGATATSPGTIQMRVKSVK
jgi:hypothetical protein